MPDWLGLSIDCAASSESKEKANVFPVISLASVGGRTVDIQVFWYVRKIAESEH